MKKIVLLLVEIRFYFEKKIVSKFQNQKKSWRDELFFYPEKNEINFHCRTEFENKLRLKIFQNLYNQNSKSAIIVIFILIFIFTFYFR